MIHPDDCQCNTYGCELRRKGVQVSPAATPNRQKHVHRPITRPSWEAGTVTTTRPNGTRMRILDGNGDPIGVKKFSENRHKFNDQLSALRSGKVPQ